jgi:hypothetical protein
LQYTPGQLRALVGIPPETFRHWKKALGPLRRGRGHSPCFAPGDLVAVAVARVLSTDVGVRIGALEPVADALFHICNGNPWPALERSKLVFDLRQGKAWLVADQDAVGHARATVSVPLGGIIAALRSQMVAIEAPGDQDALPFPPTPVGSLAKSGRRA